MWKMIGSIGNITENDACGARKVSKDTVGKNTVLIGEM